MSARWFKHKLLYLFFIIKSTDPEYGGTAIIQFGPVKLDVTLKKQI